MSQENVHPEGEQRQQAAPPEGVPTAEPESAPTRPDAQAPADDTAPADPAPSGEPAPSQEAAPQSLQDELAVTKRALEERTRDLQRLQAEYVNYKKRVDRDRELVRENATYAALAPIIEVLDTIDRAREHGELEGGFKAVADQLERVVANLGLTRFGQPGDPFDPNVHEALTHLGTDPEVSVTTCQYIAKAGYRIGDRVVRAAQVIVVDPVEPADEPAGQPDQGSAEEPAGEPVASEQESGGQ